MSNDPWVYLNGKIMPLSRASISPLDRGFLYGDGLFETLRTSGGRPHRLLEHLARLRRAGVTIALDAALDEAEIETAVADLRRRNSLDEMYVRITLTRGLHRGSLDLVSDGRTVLIFVKPLELPSESVYREGVSLMLSRACGACADFGHRPLPVKSLSYLTNLLALADARKRGFYEVLFTSERGEVLEAATANVFFVQDARLFTPSLDSGVLPGITRHAVIHLARANRIPVVERPIFPSLLAGCDEAFLTNSIVGVLPVRSIDGITLVPRLRDDDGLTAWIRRMYDQDVQANVPACG
ncbi:MAG: aminotransferase class IV [Planctomycetota bacterium]